MVRQNLRDRPKAHGSAPRWVWIPALGFTALLLTFFVIVFFAFPTLSPDRRELLQVLIAFAGGFAALFMGGTIVLHLDAPHGDLGKFAVSATGGIALFLFLYLEPPFWFKRETVAPVTQSKVDRVDNSDLSIAFDDPKQNLPLIRKPALYEGSQVFCESVRTGVIVSHNQGGDRPIRLKRLILDSERIPATPEQLLGLDYQIDALNLKPHGIVELRQYLFALKPDGVEGRFFRGLRPQDAVSVSPDNILNSTLGTEAVTISPQGDDAHFQIVALIQALKSGLYKARFDAEYDVAGQQKTVRTEWLYLYMK
jgi:hypothetical protein